MTTLSKSFCYVQNYLKFQFVAQENSDVNCVSDVAQFSLFCI